MEPEGSLQRLQVPATCPYPEPDHSSPCLLNHFLKIHLNIIPIYAWVYPLGLTLRYPHPNPVCSFPLSMRATCPAHLILLDLITRTILREEYRSLSSSLWSFLRSPTLSSLLGPNILLSTLFSNTLSLRSSLNVRYQA